MLIENKQKICSYYLRPQPQIYNTRKLGLTKTFGSDICEDCLIFRLREKRDASMNKSEETMRPAKHDT